MDAAIPLHAASRHRSSGVHLREQPISTAYGREIEIGWPTPARLLSRRRPSSAGEVDRSRDASGPLFLVFTKHPTPIRALSHDRPLSRLTLALMIRGLLSIPHFPQRATLEDQHPM